jgi:aminopeptidase
MMDPRIDKIAQILVEYSVDVQPGELVVIEGNTAGAPLVEAVYRRVIRRGGLPHLEIDLPGLRTFFMREASPEQLRFVSPTIELAVNTYQKFIQVMGEVNTRSMTSVAPERQVIRAQATQTLMKTFLERSSKGDLKWVLTLFPTHAYAQDAEMSLEEYEEFVFNACLPEPDDPIGYWQRFSEYQERWVNYLAGKHTLRIVAPDTDLTLDITGRTFINCDGRENFPDGEIFTSPVEHSANGTIRFSYPAIYDGREVEDVWLRFEAGRVVDAKAGKGEDFLLKMLDTDNGARYLGEVAIGTNKGIQRFTKEILFDEKIGGTCHLALGKSYPETGGLNDSGIHWDMVCNLRDGGEIWVDDVLIHKNGDFTFDPAGR